MLVVSLLFFWSVYISKTSNPSFPFAFYALQHCNQQHGLKKDRKNTFFCRISATFIRLHLFWFFFFGVHLRPESTDLVAKQLRCLGLSPGGWDEKRSINVAGMSLSICYCGTNFYFFTVIYHNKFCRSLYCGSPSE